MWSVQLAILGGVVSGAWVAVPAFQNFLPPVKYAALCIGASVLATILRLVDQGIGIDKDTDR